MNEKTGYYATGEPSHEVEGVKKNNFFHLEDAIGVASAAYVRATRIKTRGMFSTWVEPKVNYWPILSEEFNEIQETRRLGMGDAGNFENTGVLALLQRKVERIICFLNTYQPLDRNFKPNVFLSDGPKKTNRNHSGQTVCACTELLSLFGAIPDIKIDINYAHNQVFETEELNSVITTMLKNINLGFGAVCFKTLEVLRNDVWNIGGGFEVDILFVYNDECHKFNNELPEVTINEVVKGEKGELKDFPFYATVKQHKSDVLGLTLEEINLLSAQAETVIKVNENEVQKIFL